MPDGRYAVIRSLAKGTIVRLPDDGRRALYYFDTYVKAPGDERVQKPKFWVDDGSVIRDYDEQVEVLALPLETATMMLAHLIQAQPELRTKPPGTPSRRRHLQDHWFFPRELPAGALVYRPTGGLAIYRGMVTGEDLEGRPTCSTDQGDPLTLPVRRLLRLYGDPVHVARWYLTHAVAHGMQ